VIAKPTATTNWVCGSESAEFGDEEKCIKEIHKYKIKNTVLASFLARGMVAMAHGVALNWCVSWD
jgi:hypothetical protein